MAHNYCSELFSIKVLVFVDEYNAQLGYFAETERHIGGRFSFRVDCTENEIASSRFVPIISCPGKRPNFVIKSGPPGSFLRPHSSGLRWVTSPLVTGGVNESRIADHYVPHICT